MQFCANSSIFEAIVQVRHIGANLGSDEGIERRRREAFEFTKLRRDLRRRGDKTIRLFLEQDLFCAILMAWIQV